MPDLGGCSGTLPERRKEPEGPEKSEGLVYWGRKGGGSLAGCRIEVGCSSGLDSTARNM